MNEIRFNSIPGRGWNFFSFPSHLDQFWGLQNEWTYTSIPQYALMVWCSV